MYAIEWIDEGPAEMGPQAELSMIVSPTGTNAGGAPDEPLGVPMLMLATGQGCVWAYVRCEA